MKIEVFGTGCTKCITTKTIIKEVLERHNSNAEIIEVKEIDEIIARGVFMTPAVAIDGELKISGRVPTDSEIEQLLKL
ncbi:MAG: thioredoxin family protein [Candidatus Thorarchaeota archaeon]|nr:thioredoxin family protein [Candidatus Thorarchaeota archaeon]